MIAAANGRGERRIRRSDGLLAAYTARYGDAIRRQQSVVALRAARVEAELAYKARGTFLAHMNHELRTPLNAIVGFAGLLKEADAYGFGPDQKAEYLDHILESSELLLSHINTILEVADAESGGAKMARQAFAPGALLEDVTVEIATELAPRGVAVEADLAADLPDVLADPDRIATALRHLVRFAAHGAAHNAARGALDEDVRVTVSARTGLGGAATEWIYVAVRALGDRRGADEIGDALAIFEKVHEGLHRGVGIELSLPIAKSFVELNGGRFNVKADGRGDCVYRFALPRASASAPLDLGRIEAAS